MTLDQGALFGSLFLTGLAGSLHCVGMCGPILLAFSQVMGGASAKTDFVAYHAGRLWTYGLLGFLVGWMGFELRQESVVLGWQRPLAVAFSVVVILSGVAAAGLIPGLKFDFSLPGCGLRQQGWLAGLLRDSRLAARLLLGAVMGLLPCGMVYAMLVVVSTLPTPVHSALGMVCFGSGTLPALSAVVLGGRMAPLWVRVRGTRIAAVLVIGIGLFMLARALVVGPAGTMAHASH